MLKPDGLAILMLDHRDSVRYRANLFLPRLRTDRSMEEPARAVDGAGNPRGDVYSKEELRWLLDRFADVECFTGLLMRDMLPNLGWLVHETLLCMFERPWGWFLYAKGTRPT